MAASHLWLGRVWRRCLLKGRRTTPGRLALRSTPAGSSMAEPPGASESARTTALQPVAVGAREESPNRPRQAETCLSADEQRKRTLWLDGWQTLAFLCPLCPLSLVQRSSNIMVLGKGCGVSSLENGVLITGRVPLEGAKSTVLQLYYMRTQLGATFFLCTKRQPLPDPESASTLILAASASRTVRHEFLLFPSQSFYGIVLQQSERTRAVVITRRLISPG